MISSTLKTMTLKARGERGSGKSEILALLARLAGEVGMEARIDNDHKLTITSSADQRCICAGKATHQ